MRKTLIMFLMLQVFGLGVAWGEVRNALVIGNGAYEQVGALDNPPNDARLIANTLRDLDFEVIEVIDASQAEMKRAVRDFGSRLNEAGRDGIGLFYYAGHGVQVAGANYIIPVDAHIDREGDVDIEAVNANSVLSMMEYSNARLNFVILDACRNNPYSRGFRSAARGLAKMSAPTGSFIAYATSPGDVAVDGDGQNSPYTASLVKHITEPGVPIEKVFREVRNEVRSKTDNQQTPWESSSLIGGDFYFKTTVAVEETATGQQITVTTTAEPASEAPVGATTVAAPVATAQTLAPIQPVVIKNDANIELVFWDSVKDSRNPAMLQAYIDRYPDGVFVDLAKLKIVGLGTKGTAPTPAAKPQATQVVVTPAPVAPKAAPAPEPVTLAAAMPDPVKNKLAECNAHFKANRLTTGRGGNALDCYSQVLDKQPGNADALDGLARIEQKYALWASLYMDRRDLKKAAENIRKLRSVNEENLELPELDRRLDELTAAAEQKNAPAAQPAPQPKAQTQVQVAAKQPAAPKAARTNASDKCDGYVADGNLTGSGQSNAWSCYQAVLDGDPNNKDAKAGLSKVEDLLFAEFREEIDDKSLRMARTTMRDLKRLNPDSRHLRRMKRLYDELKMEMRW